MGKWLKEYAGVLALLGLIVTILQSKGCLRDDKAIEEARNAEYLEQAMMYRPVVRVVDIIAPDFHYVEDSSVAMYDTLEQRNYKTLFGHYEGEIQITLINESDHDAWCPIVLAQTCQCYDALLRNKLLSDSTIIENLDPKSLAGFGPEGIQLAPRKPESVPISIRFENTGPSEPKILHVFLPYSNLAGNYYDVYAYLEFFISSNAKVLEDGRINIQTGLEYGLRRESPRVYTRHEKGLADKRIGDLKTAIRRL